MKSVKFRRYQLVYNLVKLAILTEYQNFEIVCETIIDGFDFSKGLKCTEVHSFEKNSMNYLIRVYKKTGKRNKIFFHLKLLKTIRMKFLTIKLIKIFIYSLGGYM